MMPKVYKDINVYDALQKRFDVIFEKFDNIYVSFSGGKDSGVLLNLLLQYMNRKGIKRKIGLFHQDFEAQYQYTSEYVERTFNNMPTFVERYWCCIPQAVENSLSVYEPFWYTWDEQKKDLWARKMPNYHFVYNLDNHPFDFYRYRMPEEDFHSKFTAWYRDNCGGGKTICLLGIRTDESYHRYRAVTNKKHSFEGLMWTTDYGDGCYNAYPLYDWSVDDVWTANGKFGFDYNRLYDLYAKAGIPIHQMRVASPFLAEGRSGLNAYRVIDPVMWTKLVGRVCGANFGAIYGKSKALGYKNIKLPKGHTWKSYTLFLLSTLPSEARNNYTRIFKKSIKFWHETGGGMPDEVIAEAKAKGLHIKLNGKSSYGGNSRPLERVIIIGEIPDDTDCITTTKDLPSWKRMCMCILKNDYTCKSMGFAPTKQQQQNIEKLKEKYRAIIKGAEI